MTIYAKYDGLWYAGEVNLLQLLQSLQQGQGKISFQLPDKKLIVLEAPLPPDNVSTSKTELLDSRKDDIPLYEARLVEKQQLAEEMYGDN